MVVKFESKNSYTIEVTVHAGLAELWKYPTGWTLGVNYDHVCVNFQTDELEQIVAKMRELNGEAR